MSRWARLGAVVAVTVVLVPAVALADPPTRDRLRDTSQRLERAESELATVTGRVETTKQALARLAGQLASARVELGQLERRLVGARAAEATATARVQQVTTQLTAETARLDALRARLREREDAFDARVAATYKYGTVTYADALFEAHDFGDFVSSLYFVRSAMESDDGLITEVTGLVREVADRRARVDRLREVAVVEQEAAERARSDVERLTERQRKLTRQVAADREHHAELLESLEATREQYAGLVANLEAESAALAEQLRREQQRAREAALRAGRRLDGSAPRAGELAWPTDGHVTSGYGYRTHPIHGGRRLHTGVDISGASGQPIVAAAGGIVVHAGWRGGYGLTVVVDHGGGLATLYAHQSALAVVDGQWVDQGETVGMVGSTGYSTGPHLHFEVRVDGWPEDPMRWF